MEFISWVLMSLGCIVVMDFYDYGPWSLDVLIHLQCTVRRAESLPEGKETSPWDITCIDVQCTQAMFLLWALVGRVVSFQVYSIVSMLFCFLHSIKISKDKKLGHFMPMGSYAQTKLLSIAMDFEKGDCKFK